MIFILYFSNSLFFSILNPSPTFVPSDATFVPFRPSEVWVPVSELSVGVLDLNSSFRLVKVSVWWLEDKCRKFWLQHLIYKKRGDSSLIGSRGWQRFVEERWKIMNSILLYFSWWGGHLSNLISKRHSFSQWKYSSGQDLDYRLQE